jgi:hypothetical protein
MATNKREVTGMTTLRLPRAEELASNDRQVLERVARRMGMQPDQMSMIWRAQFYWPEHLEANYNQMLYSFRFQAKIPTLTKEAMHAAVSMANRCEF